MWWCSEVGRWGWLGHEGGALWQDSILINRTLGGSLSPFTVWGCSEKSAVCNLEEGSHQNLVMLVPWFGTSSLQHYKEQIVLNSCPVYGNLLDWPKQAKTMCWAIFQDNCFGLIFSVHDMEDSSSRTEGLFVLLVTASPQFSASHNQK